MTIKAQTLNTYQMLFIRYMSPIISLETVVKDYMNNMSVEHAKRFASKQQLPFPVIRLGEKAKSAWMVNIADLAVYIDKQTAIAQQDHNAMNA
ncbi:hypothetical protein AAV97_18250 [Acinetobacter sp. Ag2]|uniref:pyocin activator PrtN family protein n=1 Tax=Acinetobacter sp. Ag2 TaxID=1646532 RepID=UPI0006291EA4|nr:pyocin activator PrtN family protein [Acinetobacter sp. Ag2]KKW75728.1 hypothetical protein AAV97_18250 [Acinetobacter sp. Ag2]